MQVGFMSEKWTTDSVVILRMLQQEYCTKGKLLAHMAPAVLE